MTADRGRQTRRAPPVLARTLLLIRVPAPEREFFLGDLAEAWEARVHEHGQRSASRWYWRQTLAALVLRWPERRILPATAARAAAILPPAPRAESIMLSFVGDLHAAVRSLRRAPSSTLVAAATLALGLGAATAIYSVARPVLLEPTPYRDAARIVTIWDVEKDGTESRVGYQTMMDVRRKATTLETSGVSSSWSTSLSGEGTPERLLGQSVSSGFLETLGATPMLGRLFRADEDQQDLNRVVILSHALWERRFGGDSAVVGRRILLNETAYEVVGVFPRTFENVFSPSTEIYRPLGYNESLPWACRDCRHLLGIGRVREGLGIGEVRADLGRLGSDLLRAYPDKYAAAGFIVEPLNSFLTRGIRPVFAAISLGVVLILVLTCVNVTNVMLARAMQREGELAVMTALGAGRGRLLRHFLAEGALLAMIGGGAGVLLAWWGIQGLQLVSGDTLPRAAAVTIDPRVLLFALTLTTFCGLAASFTPALFALRRDTQAALREGSRGMTARRHRLRGVLVAAEVAMAVALLASTGLLVRSLDKLLRIDVGFEADRLLTLEVQTTGPRYRENEASWLFQERVLEAVRGLPGVADVALTSLLPLGGNYDSWGVHRVDRPSDNPAQSPSALRYGTAGDFTRTMGLRLIRGRTLTPADDRSPALVVVINETFARRVFPGEDPLGKQIRMGGNAGPPRTIVGVVGDVRHERIDETVMPQVYGPERQWQFADQFLTMVVRTERDPMSLASSIRDAIWSVDRSVPVSRVAAMRQVIATTTAVRRFAMTIFAVFAGVALFLAASGLYGVLSASVSERTREIGIRGALGASRERILRLVVTQSVRFALAGLVCGLLLAIWGSRFLAGLMYGVSPFDPVTLAVVSVALLMVAAMAAALPAHRATRVDPSIALRMG